MYEKLVKRLRTAQTLAEFVAEETAKMLSGIRQRRASDKRRPGA